MENVCGRVGSSLPTESPGQPKSLVARATLGTPGALVIGSDYRALGVVRSLGRRGITVWVITATHVLAAMSRYARRRLPWPEAGEAVHVGHLLDLATRYHLEGWAVFPTGDEAVALVARHAGELSRHYLLTTWAWNSMQVAYDKRLTYRAGAESGFDYPWTYYPKDRDDVASAEYSYPVIIKPAEKSKSNAFTYSKAWKVWSRDELLARYDEATALADPETIMRQDAIPGGGEIQFSYAALSRDGVPVASITARRTRQYPLDFGQSSSYVESVDLSEVEATSRLLLSALRFDGLVEVEYKRDPQTSRYTPLDVNPRVWGWHTLGPKKAGVNCPFLQWRLVHGEEVPWPRGVAGVRWVRMVTDLPAVLAAARRCQPSTRDYLRSLRGPIESAITAPDDPLPGLLEVPLVSYFAWKRGGVR